jgi:hypothetical protein
MVPWRSTATQGTAMPVFAAPLAHDSENREPVFGKDHARTRRYGGITFLRIVIPL